MTSQSFKNKVLIIFLSMAFISGAVFAQNNEQNRAIETEIQEKLDPELVPIEGTQQNLQITGDLLMDFGGYGRFTFLNYESGSNNYRAYQVRSLRVWQKMRFTDTLESYLRLKTSRLEYRSGDAPTAEESFKSKPKVDLGYLAYGSFPKKTPYRITAGRFFVSQGTGLVVSKVLDGGRVDFRKGAVRGYFYRGRNPKSDNNQNTAISGGAGNSKRYFNGVELTWNKWFNWRPYIGYVRERDASKERIIDLAQNYDSNFDIFIYGVRGEINPNWKASAEWVQEKGRVARFGAAHNHQPQKSQALILSSQYIFKDLGVLQYDFKLGQGDNDRNSITDVGSANASAIGRTDNNFFYFGYTDTGLLYAPRLSNIRMHHAGFTWNDPDYEKFQVDLDYYYYKKDQKRSAVSDFHHNKHRRQLGTEFDVAIKYKPWTNISFKVLMGHFFRGAAYHSSQPLSYYRFETAIDF